MNDTTTPVKDHTGRTAVREQIVLGTPEGNYALVVYLDGSGRETLNAVYRPTEGLQMMLARVRQIDFGVDSPEYISTVWTYVTKEEGVERRMLWTADNTVLLTKKTLAVFAQAITAALFDRWVGRHAPFGEKWILSTHQHNCTKAVEAFDVALKDWPVTPIEG